MPLTKSEAEQFLAAPKTLMGRFQWLPIRRQEPRKSRADQFHRPATPGRLDLICNVAINGTQPRGLIFRTSVFPRDINMATFQLECDMVPPEGKRRHHLYRLDWHPDSPHTNALRHPDPGIAGAFFAPGETHEHSCLDHIEPGSLHIRLVELHAARSVNPDPPNFDAALDYVCGRLSIGNKGDIPPAPRQGELWL